MCGPAAAAMLAVESRHWPSTALTGSGYYVSRTTRGDHLVFDAGPHGFLNGGHAHADALSCTLSIAGRPVLIDPGTGTYTMDRELRDRLRSSMMHNTVVRRRPLAVAAHRSIPLAHPHHGRSANLALEHGL